MLGILTGLTSGRVLGGVRADLITTIALASLYVPYVLAQSGGASRDPACCAIYELRQYTLRPGQRDVLIDIFDREFVESQETLGMRIFGQFRDVDNPDRFVWIRAFPDMEARKRALQAFYSGPVWKAHGKAAAATMIDADNVLLLRPVSATSGFAGLRATRQPIGASTLPLSTVVATIYSLRADSKADFVAFFQRSVVPALREAGTTPLAMFATEHSANNYPLLPVREGEEVFVWFALYGDAQTHAASLERLSKSQRWKQVATELSSYLKSAPMQLRLRPTVRSLLQ